MEKEKTEKIDVPSFEGWEVFYGRPEEHDGCYILSEHGDGLIDQSDCDAFVRGWMQICYRKIKPNRFVFEETGEFRPPKIGEFYVSPAGILQQADGNYSSPRKICKAVEE